MDHRPKQTAATFTHALFKDWNGRVLRYILHFVCFCVSLRCDVDAFSVIFCIHIFCMHVTAGMRSASRILHLRLCTCVVEGVRSVSNFAVLYWLQCCVFRIIMCSIRLCYHRRGR